MPRFHCQLCDGLEFCDAKREGFVCTRPKGHAGDHVACGHFVHGAHVWASPERIQAEFRVEVIADGSGKWCGNTLSFPTLEDAKRYVQDLAARWTLVRNARVVRSGGGDHVVWQER
jgi:hypothetical protein